MLSVTLFAALAVVGSSHADSTNVEGASDSVWQEECQGVRVPVANDLAHQRYLANVTIGTPPQHFALTIDTGSTDVWAPAANSSGCAPLCPTGFSFDPSSSQTTVDLDEVFNATYGLTPDLQVVGEYYNDTLGIGGIAVGNIPYTLYDAGYVGFVGLGSRCAEARYRNPQGGPPNPNDTYPTIYDQLNLHGYIARRMFSLWLGPQAAATGELLFGAINHSKFRGSQLRSTPVVLSDGLFTDWAINLTSFVDRTTETELLPNASAVTVILDSGAPNMYVPMAVADAIAARLNATTQAGFPYVDCAVRSLWSETLSFTFSAVEGQSNPQITVPVPEIVYPFGDPANIGEIRAADGTPLCYLGVQGTPGPVYLLGHTFQRSAYIVFDADALTISLAQAIGS